MNRRKRTPWDRILRAAAKGTGVKLTAEEVRKLSRDGAIESRGEMDSDCFDRGHDPYSCRDPECGL